QASSHSWVHWMLQLGLTLGSPDASLNPCGSLPVVTFREIWNRSFCRPREQLVDVIAEFPNEVEHLFRPSCVALQRCGGCCGDEGLLCVPVETSTVSMQVTLAWGRPGRGRGLGSPLGGDGRKRGVLGPFCADSHVPALLFSIKAGCQSQELAA
uniref:Placental growth factor n=1 Tax=Nothoprocta perdicaria TaxID=30464 RepID=A0A8C6Z905_NOTPE